MFLIGGLLVLAFVLLIGRPLINVIVDPLFVDEKSGAARSVKLGLLAALLLLVSWPVIARPLLFEFQCRFLTRLDISSPVDAQKNGYLGDRLSERSHIETHADAFYLNRDVDDIEAGRIAFFEKAIPGGFMRYSLVDLQSGQCDPQDVGANTGRPFLNRAKSAKCLSTEVSQTSLSRYVITTSGDLNSGGGTTKLKDTISNELIGMLRSFSSSSIIFQRSCGNVRITGDDYGGHVNFTKMLFKDLSGRVASPILKE